MIAKVVEVLVLDSCKLFPENLSRMFPIRTFLGEYAIAKQGIKDRSPNSEAVFYETPSAFAVGQAVNWDSSPTFKILGQHSFHVLWI